MLTPTGDNERDKLFETQLEAVYRKSYVRLVQLAYRTTLNKDDAEEVVQTVFVRLIERHGDQPGFCKNPEGYLYRATVNEALNVIGAKKREQLADEDVTSVEIEAEALAPARKDNIRRVRAALARMNPEMAELLYLFYVDELGCIEIGRLRSRLPNAIFMQLFRARVEFKKQFRIQERQDETKKAQHERYDREVLPEASEA